jgi:hypothetical protein
VVEALWVASLDWTFCFKPLAVRYPPNMKTTLSLLAIAASALANNVARWASEQKTTLTTYTTVTTCPITSTTTEKGT